MFKMSFGGCYLSLYITLISKHAVDELQQQKTLGRQHEYEAIMGLK